MNELILSTANIPAKFSFKNAKLNELSTKIAVQSTELNALYSETKDRVELINKALAPIFGELLTSKCYKEDGFKSVADYAEKTFGIASSMTYMLARVGKEFYLEDNDHTRKARETLSTSKLGELTGTDRVAISKAIDEGELDESTSLRDCREFASVHKSGSAKTKPVPTFDCKSMKSGNVMAENVTKEAMLEAVAASFVEGGIVETEAAVAFSFVKFGGDKPSNKLHFIAYEEGGFVAMYEYEPHIKKPVKAEKKPFDLQAYIKALTPEQFAEFTALVEAQKGDQSTEGSKPAKKPVKK